MNDMHAAQLLYMFSGKKTELTCTCSGGKKRELIILRSGSTSYVFNSVHVRLLIFSSSNKNNRFDFSWED